MHPTLTIADFIKFFLTAGVTSWVSVLLSGYSIRRQQVKDAKELKEDQNKQIQATKDETAKNLENRDAVLWAKMESVQEEVQKSRDYYKGEFFELVKKNEALQVSHDDLQTSYNSLLKISNRTSEEHITVLAKLDQLQKDATVHKTELAQREAHIKTQDKKIKTLEEEVKRLKAQIDAK